MESNGVMTSARHKISRRRPANSCEACRRRKIRCDQGLPCGSCVRARSALLCSYRDNLGARGPARRGSSSSNSNSNSNSRANGGGAGSGGSNGNGNGNGTERGGASPSEATPQLLTPPSPTLSGTELLRECLPDLDAPRGRGQQGLAADMAQNTASASASASKPDKGSHLADKPPVPRLRQVPEKTKFFPQHHWALVSDRIPGRKKFDAVLDKPACAPFRTELQEVLKEANLVRQQIKYQSLSHTPIPIADLHDTFPRQSTCGELVDGYLRTLEPMYRIVHVPSFLRDYRAIWDEESTQAAPHSFYAKLALILAIGTTFYATSSDQELEGLRRHSQTWIQSVQTWIAGPAEKTICTIDGFQTLCLLFLARHTTYNCAGESAWFSAKSILSTAMTMGLHRDPAIFPKLTQSQREMRVRLWTTALEFALQSSLDSSLPIGLTPDEYDVPLPSNVNDGDLHLESGNTFRTSGQFTDTSLQRLLAKSQALRLRVVRFISAISGDATGQLNDSQAYEAVLDLGAQLRAANREVAAFFQDEDFLSLRDQFDATSLHASEFHRKFIDISLRRYTLVLHRPSMVRARKDPRLYLSRKICTDSSMVILSHLKGVNMSAPSVELEDLARLALTGRGSFKGPFTFDALIALLFEVSVQLDRNSAQYSERDPYEDVTEAERAPLIKVLENARQQLFQMLGRGSASVKRYLFVMGYMKHVYDAESVQPTKTGILSYITAEVKQCLAMLRTIEKANAYQGGNLPALGDQAAPDNLAFNSGFLDPPINWDLVDMNFPGLEMNAPQTMTNGYDTRPPGLG